MVADAIAGFQKKMQHTEAEGVAAGLSSDEIFTR